MSKHDDTEPHHTASPTEHVLTELQLYGWRPHAEEPDPRPLPETDRVAGAGGRDCHGEAGSRETA